MARRKPTLTVITSPTAADELFEIWFANTERYGIEHAARYEAFLKGGINALATNYGDGKEVDDLPELRRVTLKRSSKDDGHVVIYEN